MANSIPTHRCSHMGRLVDHVRYRYFNRLSIRRNCVLQGTCMHLLEPAAHCYLANTPRRCHVAHSSGDGRRSGKVPAHLNLPSHIWTHHISLSDSHILAFILSSLTAEYTSHAWCFYTMFRHRHIYTHRNCFCRNTVDAVALHSPTYLYINIAAWKVYEVTIDSNHISIPRLKTASRVSDDCT